MGAIGFAEIPLLLVALNFLLTLYFLIFDRLVLRSRASNTAQFIFIHLWLNALLMQSLLADWIIIRHKTRSFTLVDTNFQYFAWNL